MSIKKLIIAITLIVIVVIAIKVIPIISNNRVDNNYNAEVKNAYAKSFDKLRFPVDADNAYKEKAGVTLMGCFNNCLTDRPGSIGTQIPHDSCDALCECTTNGLMEALGAEFILHQPSSAAYAKGGQALDQCINKYKKQ